MSIKWLSRAGIVLALLFNAGLHAQSGQQGRPYYELNGQYYYYNGKPYQQGATNQDPYPSTVPYDQGNGSAGYENYDNDSGAVEADQLFNSYNR